MTACLHACMLAHPTPAPAALSIPTSPLVSPSHPRPQIPPNPLNPLNPPPPSPQLVRNTEIPSLPLGWVARTPTRSPLPPSPHFPPLPSTRHSPQNPQKTSKKITIGPAKRLRSGRGGTPGTMANGQRAQRPGASARRAAAGGRSRGARRVELEASPAHPLEPSGLEASGVSGRFRPILTLPHDPA